MDFGLKNKTALVLGAGGGLGGAIALSLASEGALVAVADISLDAAEATVARIVGEGGRAVAVQWDLANLDAIASNVARIEAEMGPVATFSSTIPAGRRRPRPKAKRRSFGSTISSPWFCRSSRSPTPYCRA